MSANSKGLGRGEPVGGMRRGALIRASGGQNGLATLPRVSPRENRGKPSLGEQVGEGARTALPLFRRSLVQSLAVRCSMGKP